MEARDGILALRAVSAGYGKNKIIHDIEFEIKRGELVALIGANGSGKSTLLKTIYGAITPMSGEILLDGRLVSGAGRSSEYSRREMAKRLSILTTERVTPELISVREVVESGRYPYSDILGRLSDEDRKASEEILRLAGLEGMADMQFAELSDGQRQRVMLARAICKEPLMLIMDEPTTFLDIKYKRELVKLMERLRTKKGMSILVSMHELELVRQFADRVICMRDGRIMDILENADMLTEEYINKLFDLE